MAEMNETTGQHLIPETEQPPKYEDEYVLWTPRSKPPPASGSPFGEHCTIKPGRNVQVPAATPAAVQSVVVNQSTGSQGNPCSTMCALVLGIFGVFLCFPFGIVASILAGTCTCSLDVHASLKEVWTQLSRKFSAPKVTGG